MEQNAETTGKRPSAPFTGVEGKTFSADYQPAPEDKKAGWERRRAERLLTQKILEKLTKGNTLDTYVNSLLKNAKKGNPKAIETINKGIEDDIIRTDITSGGEKITWNEVKTYKEPPIEESEIQ